MKNIMLTATFLYVVLNCNAQVYPEPEFTNEVYYLKKDSVHTLVRLEKEMGKMDNRVKAAGFGGMENGYVMDSESSGVRISNSPNLSFVYSTGASASAGTTAQGDSVMMANGINPGEMNDIMGSMSDPSKTITLYKTNAAKGKRKIYLMKTGGAFSMGKNKSSDKFSFSTKKIREGYWVLVIDKPLPKGEYAFAIMNSFSGSGGMDALLFAFAVD